MFIALGFLYAIVPNSLKQLNSFVQNSTQGNATVLGEDFSSKEQAMVLNIHKLPIWLSFHYYAKKLFSKTRTAPKLVILVIEFFMTNKRTILYILSNQRSGSTLLENVLSKSSEITSVGELYHLDSHIHKGKWGETWEWNCSCGRSFEVCEFWGEIYNKIGIANPKEIKKTEVTGTKNVDEDNVRMENEKTIALLNNIYDAVFMVSGNSIIVDSSKVPFQGISLYENSPFDFKIIHLKRDLRAIAVSKKKWSSKFKKKNVSLLKLLLANFYYKMMCKQMLKKVDSDHLLEISYENFMNAPQYHLDKIADFANFEKFAFPEYMELQNDHTVAGTPNRFVKRKISYDNRWESVAKKNPFFNILGYLLSKIG